jgi:predicted RND superfamily exporter protein
MPTPRPAHRRHERPKRREVFGMIAGYVLRHPRLWALVVLVSTIAAALLAVNLGVDSDVLKLMPPDDPTVQALADLDRTEGGIAFLSIAVTGDDQAKIDAYMADLEPRLEALHEVRYAMWRIDPEVAPRLAVMQLSQADLSQIRDRLRGALALGPAAANPFIAGRLMDLGPLTAKLSTSQTFNLAAAPNSGRMIVRPAGSAHDIPFARRLMDKVHAVIAESTPEEKGVRIAWIGGPYRHAIEDVDGIDHDLAWTSIAAIVLISLAILLAYRDWRAVLVIMVPQVVGSVWTLGFAKIAVGSVNMFTSFAVAVLVGLGNDYAIVLFSRYREEKAAGHTTKDAILRSWDRAGPPSLTAALTSAAGFFSLLVAQFRGFQQLGIIIGVGVPLCFIAVVVTAPLLLTWLDPEPKGGLLPSKVAVDARTGPVSYPWALPVLVGSAMLTLVAAVAIPRIHFDFDLSALRAAGLAFDELPPEEQALAQQSYTPIVVDYPDAASLTQDYDRITAEIAAGGFPEISRALSIRTLIPVDAPERAAIIDEIARLAHDPNARYLPSPVQKNLAVLTATPDGKKFSLTADDLPAPLLNLLGADAGHHRMLLLPTGNMWDLSKSALLASAIREHLPGRKVAGEYLIQGTLYEWTLKDLPRVGIVALLLVTILMAFDLRRAGATAWGMGVQVAGLIWAGGALVPLGLEFNLVNIVGIPICVGTGIEFAIFLMHRLDDEGPHGVRKAVLTSGLASVLCMVTTLLGFASLLFANSRGIRSLGVLVCAGDAVHAIAGFIMLPAGAALIYTLQARWATKPAS